MDRKSKNSHGENRLEGRYANYFKVGYNTWEFVFDFGQFYSENEGTQFHTRIITSPSYAKALLKTLEKSIAQYERTFGQIKEEEYPHSREPWEAEGSNDR